MTADGFQDLADDGGHAPGESADAGSYFDSTEFALRRHIEETHYWHVHRRQVIARELQRFARPEECGKLVELGCGIGTVATHLNMQGYEVDYSDVFGEALTIAKARLQEQMADTERQFVRLDVTKPLPENDYAGMMLFDVIEHLPDDRAVLKHVHAALTQPDAFVVLTVPAFQLLWSPWDDMEKHKRRYTAAGLNRLLEECGFSVVRSTYFFGALFFAALGVKGVRQMMKLFGRGGRAEQITDLAEGKSIAPVNVAMRGVLWPEQLLLKRASLPLGTSILVIAKRR